MLHRTDPCDASLEEDLKNAATSASITPVTTGNSVDRNKGDDIANVSMTQDPHTTTIKTNDDERFQNRVHPM